MPYIHTVLKPEIKIQKDVSLDFPNYSQYHIIVSINKMFIAALIDTGACSSHVSLDLANEIFEIEETSYVTYKGEEVKMNKGTKLEIIFSKNLMVNIDIPIDNKLKGETKDLLLGIDFLDQFDYQITKENLILDGIKIPRVNMYYKEIQEALERLQ